MKRLGDSGHRDAIERVVREDATRIVATLIRKTGSIDRGEDALQEALTGAVTSWATSGVPMNPSGWVMAVAQRKAIDVVRRARTREHAAGALAYEASKSVAPIDEPLDAFASHPDDRLRLIFT